MKRREDSLKTQMIQRSEEPLKPLELYEGDTTTVVSTGSTLLDLAISGTRIRGGGIPIGIMVEVSGLEGIGKTVLLSEIGGAVKARNGDMVFFDPEGRINKHFARMFGVELDDDNYDMPKTVVELFTRLREWEPEREPAVALADSLAALSTEMEMESEDKMGGKRAKDFSQELRKTCLLLPQNKLLLVCTNQLRENMGGGPYSPKYVTPGGKAIPYYSSLRLRFHGSGKKVKKEVQIAGKKVERVVAIESEIEVIKSTVDKPYRTAPFKIIFDYGVDDIGPNLQFIKQFTSNNTYTIGDDSLGRELDGAIKMIEEHGMENELREQVINLWTDIESKFKQERKPKSR